MNLFRSEHRQDPLRFPVVQDFHRIANDICERALKDARQQLHPLIRDNQLGYLRKRSEFVRAFKLALEQRIAHKLAIWQPGTDAIFQFDESWTETRHAWDGTIHLLLKVHRFSGSIKALEKKLNQNLMYSLTQLGWKRFGKRQSILEIQQVTLAEFRHGIGYGAMFYAVHSVPVKVWPIQGKPTGRC